MYDLVINGDVPDEVYFNGLMNQSIIPCTSGTRPTATHDGMTVWETDTNLHATWDGAAWIYPYSPAYTSITPTFYSNANAGTAIGGGSVTVTYARYQAVNKRVHYYGHAVINTTTGSGLAVSLPSDLPALQRSFALGSCYLQGAGAYTDSFGNCHVPSMAAPYTRFGPVSRSNAQLNILTSADTVHWNINYEAA